MKTKNLLIISVLLLFSQLSIAQLKVESTGKVSVGAVHTLDNGRIKIGNDGSGDGISFYNAQYGGTDARIFRSSTLQAGMYLYSLVADGQEVDTKRMILTK